LEKGGKEGFYIIFKNPPLPSSHSASSRLRGPWFFKGGDEARSKSKNIFLEIPT
jgi:hypothetical protein